MWGDVIHVPAQNRRQLIEASPAGQISVPAGVGLTGHVVSAAIQGCCNLAGEGMHDLQLDAILYDLAAEAGKGHRVGQAVTHVAISKWTEGQPHEQTMTFLDEESTEV